MTKKSFYITTAISYTNAVPHIGHAYEAIAADVVARFKRLDGYDVRFVTGTDDHGQKVDKSAKEAGVSNQEFVDNLLPAFKDDMCDALGITYDRFIRTTDEDHKATVQEIWKKMEANGDIYLDKYAGWYSIRDEAFYTEDEIETLPDGSKLSRETKTELEWVEEESYFFKLSEYTDKLLKLYEDHPEFVQPDFRRNEIVAFVKQGLRDLSISRTSFDWGVPVPDNDKHIMYVWVDALTNYISALNYTDDKEGLFSNFWPCDRHLVGKDIMRFHTIYWPAFLMSAGIELPKQVYGHGFLLSDGEKMSKSVGNVIAPKDLMDKYGVDQTRYVLMREGVFGQDVSLTYESMTARINAELANNVGNLAQRSLSMINKNCDSKIPEQGDLLNVDRDLLNQTWQDMMPIVRADIENMQFSRALEKIIYVASEANTYIDEQAPWTLKKTDPVRMNTVLYVLSEVIRCITIVMQPFTPEASEKLLNQMNIAKNERDFVHISADFAIKAGTEIPKPEGVYPRIIEEEAA